MPGWARLLPGESGPRPAIRAQLRVSTSLMVKVIKIANQKNPAPANTVVSY